MADYTFHSLIEPLRNNNTIQTVLDIDALAAPAKSALLGYTASLNLLASQTQHLLWANIGVAVVIESLSINYYLPSLGIQTPAPALKRNSTLQDRVVEMQALESKFPKCQMLIFARTSAVGNWIWLNTEVIQNSGNRVNTIKLLPYINQSDIFIPGRGTQIGIQFIADPVSNSTLPQTQDRVTVQGSVRLDVNPIDLSSKKNDVEALTARLAAMELALEGRLVNLPANSLLGRQLGTGTVERIPASTYATPAQLDAAISALIGGATQVTLDTLSELGAALGNDPNFATTITTALGTKVDLATNQTVNGIKNFAEPIKTPYFQKDITTRITTGVNWLANNWYLIPNLGIPFNFGEVRLYCLTANYQYSDGTNSYSHWQMSGHCFLPGGIGWKAGGIAAEVIMAIQAHNGADNNFTFRSAIGAGSRGLEIKPNFNIVINGLGFIEFELKRFR